MPRPKREEVHKHFESLAESPSDQAIAAAAAVAVSDVNGSAGHADTADNGGPPDGTPDAQQKMFKHARVRCRHCGWCSKRDASRQAKHLSQCAEYRAWCSLKGETVVSLTAAPKRNIDSSQNEGDVHQNSSNSSSKRRPGVSRITGSPMARDISRPGDGLYYGNPTVDLGSASSRTPRSGGGQLGADVGFISPPAPANPRTGVYQGQNGVPLGPGPSSLMGGAGALGHRYGHGQTYGGGDDGSGERGGGGGLQVHALGEAERRRLNILYARALVAIGIKDNDFYDRTRHPQMCAFLKALNPGYEPPPKEELGALVVREFFGGMGAGNDSRHAAGAGGETGSGGRDEEPDGTGGF